MEPVKRDITPSDEWIISLNATCNRLSTQYLNLLKSASSLSALNNSNYYSDIIDTTPTTATTITNVVGADGGSSGGISSSGATVATTLAGTAGGNNTNTGSSAAGTNTTSNITATHQYHDPRAGGGYMTQNDMVAPPPLAADVAIHTTVQCQLCIENICVATSQILNLIRTLRLSLLLMDEETISAEEYVQVQQTKLLTVEANKAAMELEHQYMELLRKQLE